MRTLKRKSEESLDRGRNVIAKLNNNMPVSVAAALPKIKSMAQTVCRVRSMKDIPLAPTSLKDLVIPDNLSHIKNVQFLLYDSCAEAGPNRILIFSSERNLETLRRADVLSMDGTFDIVPPLFSQLYTLQFYKVYLLSYLANVNKIEVVAGRIDGWYVESTYIGVAGRNGKRKAVLFPPELWSVHEMTILGKQIIY